MNFRELLKLLNQQDQHSDIQLMEMCRYGDFLAVKRLLAKKVNATVCNKDGLTAIHIAAANGHLQICNLLIEEGLINVPDKTGCVALHQAALHGRTEIAKRLFEVHADVNQKNIDGVTPLHAAAQSGELEMIAWLIANGAKINAQDRYNKTPLDYAIYNDQLEAVRRLLNAGAEIPHEIEQQKNATIAKEKWDSLFAFYKAVRMGNVIKALKIHNMNEEMPSLKQLTGYYAKNSSLFSTQFKQLPLDIREYMDNNIPCIRN